MSNDRDQPRDWNADDELRLTLRIGLKKGLASIRGARRIFNEDEQNRIAAAILEHLRLANYQVTAGPARLGHGRPAPRSDS